MHNLHNIEKSGFRRGEYVGYAHGVWGITRYNSGWRGWHTLDAAHSVLYTNTLLEAQQPAIQVQPAQ